MNQLLRRLSQPLRLTIDSEAARGGEHARRTGRSWWSLRYVDGTILREWERDPGSPNGHMDWPRLAMLGRLKRVNAVRLYCPNGRMVELGGQDNTDQTGRLFQFKVAVRHIGFGAAVLAQETMGHVVGQITGYDGQCVLFAWEPRPEPPRPNPDDFKNTVPGTLATVYAEWKKTHQTWKQSGGGELVGPFGDNVYQLAYQNVGRLSADHLGIADGEGK
jgi:hypothetical protein